MTETTENSSPNVDPAEIDKFNDLAARWWDTTGEMKPLHQMNPCRVDYIDTRASVEGKRCLDIGCGGGILSEGLAERGAIVTGIDMAPASLAVAEAHRDEAGLEIRYLQASAEELSDREPGAYDIVTCLEVVEHVPDPVSLIASCAALVRPGGDVILSTINRHPKAFAMAIVGAEYLLGILPKGTHDYNKFIQPAELEAWGRKAGLILMDLTGLHYAPFTETFSLGGNVDVNYLAHFHAPEPS